MYRQKEYNFPGTSPIRRLLLLIPIMGRSHRPRGPGRRTSLWQPVPLHVPVDPPSHEPKPTPHTNRYPGDGEIDHGSGPTDDDDDVGGNHVIVIDFA